MTGVRELAAAHAAVSIGPFCGCCRHSERGTIGALYQGPGLLEPPMCVSDHSRKWRLGEISRADVG